MSAKLLTLIGAAVAVALMKQTAPDIFTVRNCNTPGRSLTLKNPTAVNEDAMRAGGVHSVVHVGDSPWHVIVGPPAEAAAKALQAL